MINCITGGCGFIGSHLTETLLARGERVRILDIQPWEYKLHPNLEVIECDIRGGLPSFFGIDRIYHLAALADIVPSIEKPLDYYDTNVSGTLNILEAARKFGVQRFVYAASGSCYGLSDTPTPETAPIDTQYPYALTKYLGEQLVGHWAKVYKIPAVSMRLFNVYGPRSRTAGAYGAMFGVFLAQLANMRPLTVVGDGTQSRDFTFVTDVVDALIKAADNDISGIYNVGSGAPSSVNRIVELLGSPEVVYIPKRPGEPDITHADINKIQRDLGWEPKVTIEQGVRIMLENLSAFKDAPVWNQESIGKETEAWFTALK